MRPGIFRLLVLRHSVQLLPVTFTNSPCCVCFLSSPNHPQRKEGGTGSSCSIINLSSKNDVYPSIFQSLGLFVYKCMTLVRFYSETKVMANLIGQNHHETS